MKEQKIIRILTYFYLIPFALMVVFNIFNSLLRTTYFDLYQVMETARYKWDNPFIVLAASVGIIVCFYFLMRIKWVKKIRIERLALIYSAVVCLLIVLLFRSVVTCDSGLISDIAIEFMQKNYRAFEQGEYLYRYSFQIGFAALLELIYYIFGVENFIVFHLVNIVCIVIILKMVGKITKELFDEERVGRIEAVLSMGMLPLFLFSTFVYGDIIGWSFGACSIYFLIRYLKTDRWQNILKAAVLLSAGIIVKSNINILLVAAVAAII
ncbi:MAG: glycosyltransferase family 39 protein, partial [Lachnospiraceae bacterium]|nr:glycosyltransferase family 39 protein [Lachnospiraceae bacterium]